jgi:hypothetical protein
MKKNIFPFTIYLRNMQKNYIKKLCSLSYTKKDKRVDLSMYF